MPISADSRVALAARMFAVARPPNSGCDAVNYVEVGTGGFA
jgi:hypothetical protein